LLGVGCSMRDKPIAQAWAYTQVLEWIVMRPAWRVATLSRSWRPTPRRGFFWIYSVLWVFHNDRCSFRNRRLWWPFPENSVKASPPRRDYVSSGGSILADQSEDPETGNLLLGCPVEGSQWRSFVSQ
jgi:hypothetical protein